MKTPEEIKLAHSYYKRFADLALEMIRENDRTLIEDDTYARKEMGDLTTRFRQRQYALEFIMPELKTKD